MVLVTGSGDPWARARQPTSAPAQSCPLPHAGGTCARAGSVPPSDPTSRGSAGAGCDTPTRGEGSAFSRRPGQLFRGGSIGEALADLLPSRSTICCDAFWLEPPCPAVAVRDRPKANEITDDGLGVSNDAFALTPAIGMTVG
jgi:hypothetical protein